MQDNIVGIGRDNGLTLKQERFARAAASGKTLVGAAEEAGYVMSEDCKPSIPYRLIQNEKIQARISALINEGALVDLARSRWHSILSDDVSELKAHERVKMYEVQLKAIDQIARLGGWEPNKVSETKSLVLKGNLDELLPK